jgi:predicted ATP-grasp superfamily ATP-dependent carboligase
MKIAFLCLNLVDAFRRAEAFIKNCPDDEFTIVITREEHDKVHRPEARYIIPYPNVTYIEDKDFISTDFDLTLTNNDKACTLLFDRVYSGKLPNLSDKVKFNILAQKFGEFDMLRSNAPGDRYQFAPEDDVMLKPSNSSGGFSEIKLCYNKRKFKEVKGYGPFTDRFIIQEYVDSNDILLLSFISNGVDLVLYDVVEQEFRQSNLHLLVGSQK